MSLQSNYIWSGISSLTDMFVRHFPCPFFTFTSVTTKQLVSLVTCDFIPHPDGGLSCVVTVLEKQCVFLHMMPNEPHSLSFSSPEVDLFQQPSFLSVQPDIQFQCSTLVSSSCSAARKKKMHHDIQSFSQQYLHNIRQITKYVSASMHSTWQVASHRSSIVLPRLGSHSDCVSPDTVRFL